MRPSRSRGPPDRVLLLSQNDLANLPEWKTYATDPTRANFLALKGVTRVKPDLRLQLPAALARLWLSNEDWRIALHAALIAQSLRLTTLASYFSIRALRQSGGDVRARLLLARLYWDRRLAVAVLNETEIARFSSRRDRGASRRRLQTEIAILNVRSHAYLGELARAARWLIFLQHGGGADTETLVYFLFCARHHRATDAQAYVSRLLVPTLNLLGPRPRAAVQAGVRLALLNLLRGRG